MAVCRKDRAYKQYTNNPIPTSFFFHRQCCFPVISENSLRRMSHTKKDVGMGLFVYCLYALSFLHTAIPTPSFCGFWHCHPYIPLHFWKMFFILVCVHFCCTIVLTNLLYTSDRLCESWRSSTAYTEVDTIRDPAA